MNKNNDKLLLRITFFLQFFSKIVNKNGSNFLKNTTIIKDSTNGSFYGMFMEKSEKMDNSVGFKYFLIYDIIIFWE